MSEATATTTTTSPVSPVSDPEPVMTSTPASTPEAPPVKLTRDQIREAILGSKVEAKALTLFGVPIYLKPPTIDVLMNLQQNENKKEQFTQALVLCVYTEDGEPVLELSDADALVQLPFGTDMKELQQEIQAMLGVTPTPETKSETPT